MWMTWLGSSFDGLWSHCAWHLLKGEPEGSRRAEIDLSCVPSAVPDFPMPLSNTKSLWYQNTPFLAGRLSTIDLCTTLGSRKPHPPLHRQIILVSLLNRHSTLHWSSRKYSFLHLITHLVGPSLTYLTQRKKLRKLKLSKFKDHSILEPSLTILEPLWTRVWCHREEKNEMIICVGFRVANGSVYLQKQGET